MILIIIQNISSYPKVVQKKKKKAKLYVSIHILADPTLQLPPIMTNTTTSYQRVIKMLTFNFQVAVLSSSFI